MKKQIRLLIENLFDDIYDDNFDLSSEIAKEHLAKRYNVGDVVYDNNIPYAICCGSKDDFYDKSERFLYLYNNEKYKLDWCSGSIKSWRELNEPVFHKYDEFVNEFEEKVDNEEIDNLDDDGEEYYDWNPNEKDCKLYFGYNLSNKNDFMHIDEDGYNNTQIIKNKHNLNDFPVFKECCNLGDNIYLPAIDELQILFLNLESNKNNLRTNINEIKKEFNLNYNINQYLYWSSSLLYVQSPYYIKLNSALSALKCSYYHIQILSKYNYLKKSIIPFIKF